VPEFSEEFYDTLADGLRDLERNFIVVSYVTGDHLDQHVSLERGGFEFPNENPDLIHEVSQKQIEKSAAKFARLAVDSEVKDRRGRKIKLMEEYARDQAPWHRETLTRIDYDAIPHNPSPSQIDNVLHQQDYSDETQVKDAVRKLGSEPQYPQPICSGQGTQ
jgi:hypothetical protein